MHRRRAGGTVLQPPAAPCLMTRCSPPPQTGGSSREKPDKFSQAEVDHFISKTLAWMEATPYVERYAWHDPKTGTCALFTDKGELTPTGRAYAAGGGGGR